MNNKHILEFSRDDETQEETQKESKGADEQTVRAA